MNIAIVDDEKKESGALEEVLREYVSANGNKAVIDIYESAEEFLGQYEPFMYTVIYLDIYMKGMSGVDAAARIREKDAEALIVFVTSSADHMQEALKLHAYDYVEKPVEKERVFHLMDDIMRRRADGTKGIDFVSERQEHHLPFDDIISLCANGHSVEIVDKEGNHYQPYVTFASLEKPLSADKRFLTINRGVIVNMDCIQGFAGGLCRMNNGESFPAKQKSFRQLEQIWQNYMFCRLRDEMPGRH
ncbi:MAG: LytTR family DNA-binding domain-containing protein [Lachnospiraceae bacterium]|nr:LytTR family DNA-binding domain-containing protein [Lachnospiraceae bacterium]